MALISLPALSRTGSSSDMHTHDGLQFLGCFQKEHKDLDLLICMFLLAGADHMTSMPLLSVV